MVPLKWEGILLIIMSCSRWLVKKCVLYLTLLLCLRLVVCWTTCCAPATINKHIYVIFYFIAVFTNILWLLTSLKCIGRLSVQNILNFSTFNFAILSKLNFKNSNYILLSTVIIFVLIVSSYVVYMSLTSMTVFHCQITSSLEPLMSTISYSAPTQKNSYYF